MPEINIYNEEFQSIVNRDRPTNQQLTQFATAEKKVTEKIFGIGFHKTATTSLAASLYILGYNVTGSFNTHSPDVALTLYKHAFELADRFDAVQDTPWPVLYKVLDQRYPNSKFILTVRPTEQWIDSVVRHFHFHHIPLHEWIYGVKRVIGHEHVYIQRYETHNQEVLEYFKDRPNDLLVMDITQGDGWEKLCAFLCKEIPPISFPAQNMNSQRRVLWQRGMIAAVRKINHVVGMTEYIQLDNSIGVSAVRDILHYHCATTQAVWDAVKALSDEQFRQVSPYTGFSLQTCLLALAVEEARCLQQLQSKRVSCAPMSDSAYQTKADVYRYWNETQMALRHYAAYLATTIVNEKIPNSTKYVWELFEHLYGFGVRQRTYGRAILRSFGIASSDENFIDFFHHLSA